MKPADKVRKVLDKHLGCECEVRWTHKYGWIYKTPWTYEQSIGDNWRAAVKFVERNSEWLKNATDAARKISKELEK